MTYFVGGSMIISAGVSYSGAKNSADAQANAAAAQMAPFNLKKPYLEDMYKGTELAVDTALSRGAYSGQTYAGMDPRTAEGLDYQYDTALRNAGLANNIMGQTGGFATNAADLYNMASQDQLQGAMDYASGSRLDGLTDSAMRDSYRTLTESTLPQIDRKASATGNMNSSRAGIADAVAMRGYDDRLADTRSDIQAGLMDDYLKQSNQQYTNMTNANNNLASYFGDAYGFQSGVASDLVNVGRAYQGDEQGYLTNAANQYELQRMDELGILSQQANIMGEAPQVGKVTPNLYDPTAAGLTGGISAGTAAWEMMGKPNLFSSGTTTPPPPVYQADPFTGAQTQVFHSPVAGPATPAPVGF